MDPACPLSVGDSLVGGVKVNRLWDRVSSRNQRYGDVKRAVGLSVSFEMNNPVNYHKKTVDTLKI